MHSRPNGWPCKGDHAAQAGTPILCLRRRFAARNADDFEETS